MKGYFRKRGDKWSFTVDIGRDPSTGKRKQKTRSGFKTKKEAQQACAELITQLTKGDYIPNSNELFKEFLYKWLELYVKPKLRHTTYKNYKRTIDYRIIPILGEIELQKLTPAHGQAFVKHLIEDNLSERYIEFCFTITKGALIQAIKWELISKNPFQYIEIPRPRRFSRKNAWSAEDVNTFLTFAKYDNQIYYYIFMLALFTGMRRGELLGLTWDNIDLEKRKISITKSLIYDEEGFRFGDVKTASSRRTISIGDEECKELKQYKAMQNSFKLKIGSVYHDQNLVFCREDGNPIYPRTLAMVFDRITKKAGLHKIRLHDLRHTHATLSLQLGMPPKVLQERLGHSSIQMTMDVYSHVMPNMQQEAAETFSQKLRKNFS